MIYTLTSGIKNINMTNKLTSNFFNFKDFLTTIFQINK